ncbi:MAG TPA: transglycosylase [Xanthobacteraceae bacterium]|nr:transglycosylase [Xanthobacteraceae bacterium]
MILRALQLAFIILAIAVIYPFSGHEPVLFPKDTATPDGIVRTQKSDRLTQAQKSDEDTIVIASLPPAEQAALPPSEQTKIADDHPFFNAHSAEAGQLEQDLTYLADYAYSEVPPDQKPADTILATLKDVPVGAPIEEIKRASDALGIDFTFMKTVAKIESDFDPKQRTGSYIGLFQLSNYEFDKYGAGSIISPRDNAIAAAYKFTTAAILFEIQTHKKPTLSDLYLIHQQGTQGAAEHVSHPERVAWKSMCATDEGRQKGEKWCKRAIWQNTLPAIKQIWKSVENLTSGAFVEMWQQRVAQFYTRYSAAVTAK